MKRTILLVFIGLLIALTFFHLLTRQAALEQKLVWLEADIEVLHEDKQLLLWQNYHLTEQVIWLIEDRENEEREAILELRDILGAVEVREFEVSAYAPLDPAAVPGMCFSGDPNVTASGGRPIPGETVAAGPGIPFGSRVWIEGVGIRTVNDRGSRITDEALDVVFATRAEALMFGRQQLRAAVLP